MKQGEASLDNCNGGSEGQGVDDTSDFITRGKMDAICVLQISAWDPTALLFLVSELILYNSIECHATVKCLSWISPN